MLRLLRSLRPLLGTDAKATRGPRPGGRAPQLEALQDRLVPAFVVGTFHVLQPVAVVDGDLQINGTASDDSVQVFTTQEGRTRVIFNGTASAFDLNAGARILFHGYAGNDQFTNSTNLRSIAYGDEGADTLRGGSNIDYLYGGRDDDWLYGGEGDDYLDGGWDFDVLNGEGGSDTLVANGESDAANDLSYNYLDGGTGDDRLYGGAGRDGLYGGAGNDTIIGGTGDDTIDGGTENDRLYGDDGNDRIYGGDGNDLILCGVGDDVADGNAGNDSVLGEDGNDFVHGDAGYDFVFGGAGDDGVRGGEDDDLCFGGTGSDGVNGDDGDDVVSGGTVDFDPVTGIGDFSKDPSDGSVDFVIGGAGHDVFFIGDPRYFRGRLDDAQDETSADTTEVWSVTGPYFDFHRTYGGYAHWGHLYGT
jgi:Ca2+-binding RTX toxin-like protein